MCPHVTLARGLGLAQTPFYRWANWVWDLKLGLPVRSAPTSAGDIWPQEEHAPSLWGSSQVKSSINRREPVVDTSGGRGVGHQRLLAGGE